MSTINIEQKKATFIKWFNYYVNRPGKEEILQYLESTDFFIAPASKKNHLAVPGGLCAHSLNVARILVEQMMDPGTTWNKYAIAKGITRENCVVVGLLHDICKANFYVPDTKSEKHREPEIIEAEAAAGTRIQRDKYGDYVWQTIDTYSIEDQDPLGHGEGSVIRILENAPSFKLTPDEKYAIRWHMGFSKKDDEWGPMADAMHKSPFVIATHFADLTATYLMEDENNAAILATGNQLYQQMKAQEEAAKNRQTNPAGQNGDYQQNTAQETPYANQGQVSQQMQQNAQGFQNNNQAQHNAPQGAQNPFAPQGQTPVNAGGYQNGRQSVPAQNNFAQGNNNQMTASNFNENGTSAQQNEKSFEQAMAEFGDNPFH